MGLDVSPLFSPLMLNGLKLPNRFVMPAMQRGWGVDGQVSDKTIEYYCERVDGGVGLLISEGLIPPDPAAHLGHSELEINADTRDGWARCVDAVKGRGGNFLAQIWHPGPMRMEGQGRFPDVLPVSPSGLFANAPRGRAATRDDLKRIVSAFVEAALLAEDVGFDGIEIHMAHGYLFHQFLWNTSNRRDDEYGGEMVSRVRFPAEVVSAIRQATRPGFVISCRLSQWCEIDYAAKVADSPEELEIMLSALRMAGADAFHMSTRHYYSREWADDPRTIAAWVSELTDATVITVGSVGVNIDLFQTWYSDDEEEETVQKSISDLLSRLENDEFDLVAVGRALIGDPQFVNKVREGRVGDIRPFTRMDLGHLLDVARDENAVPKEVMEQARRA